SNAVRTTSSWPRTACTESSGTIRAASRTVPIRPRMTTRRMTRIEGRHARGRRRAGRGPSCDLPGGAYLSEVLRLYYPGKLRVLGRLRDGPIPVLACASRRDEIGFRGRQRRFFGVVSP